MPIPGCSTSPPAALVATLSVATVGGRSDVRAVRRLGRRPELAAVARAQPRQSSPDTGLLQEVGRRRSGPRLAERRARRRLLERGGRRRPHLHDGRPWRRPVRSSPCRRPTESSSGRRRSGPAWDDGYPGPRGTPTVDGDLVYAVGTEGDVVAVETATGKERWRAQPDPRLRRPDHVQLEVQRVAARRRRSASSSHPAARGAALVALDKRTGEAGVERRDARPRRERTRRRRLLVDRDLERRRREAVRAAPRPRARRHSRLGRRVPLGLQPRGQQRRQHLDAGGPRRLRVLRRPGIRRAARC